MLEMTLKKKLGTFKALDAVVIDLIEDEVALTDEIERADNFKKAFLTP